jgi:hypothetical protein
VDQFGSPCWYGMPWVRVDRAEDRQLPFKFSTCYESPFSKPQTMETRRLCLQSRSARTSKFCTWIECSQSLLSSETLEQYSAVPPNHRPHPCVWLIVTEDDATKMILSSAMPLSSQGHRIITVATIGIISLYLVPCFRGAYVSSRCPYASLCFSAATEDREM